MTTLSPFLVEDHRRCDDELAAVETAVQKKQWQTASPAWTKFAADVRCHFAREEVTLFPAFERATGMRGGPTMVMRMEHEQMRQLLDELGAAIAATDGKRFLALSESLMVLTQQHNMKEEQVLYPMFDDVLAGDAGLLQRVQAQTPEE